MMKTNKQWMVLGGVIVVVLTSALGVAVTQRQAKIDAVEEKARAEQQAATLREKLQKTESDLAALARTAASHKITPTPVAAPAKPDSDPAPLAVDPDLQQQLAQKDTQIAALREQLAQAQQQRPGPPRNVQDWQQRMEQLRQENPEEYQRLEQEREQRRQDIVQRTNDRMAFFSAIPIEGLSEEYLANHQEFLKKMKFFNDAMAAMTVDPTSEASQVLRGQMREQLRGVREMVDMEKDVLLNDLFTNLGVKSDAAGEAIDYIRYVDEMTSMNPWGRGGPGGGRGGGSDGGGGPGR